MKLGVNTKFLISNPEIRQEICFFYLLKSRFSNSIIYNYSSRNLAKKLGISHNQTNKYIKRLRELGWLVIDNNSNKAKLKSFREVIGREKVELQRIKISKSAKLPEIKKAILSTVILENLVQQSFWITQKSDLNKSQIRLKKYKALIKKYGDKIWGELDRKVKLSTKTVSKKLNVSSSYASDLFKYLVKNGLVNKFTNIKVVGTAQKKYWSKISDEFKGCFISNRGVVYKRYCNSFEVSGGVLSGCVIPVI